MNTREYPILHLDTNYRKGTACIVRKDIDVNEYERLSDITLRHKIK